MHWILIENEEKFLLKFLFAFNQGPTQLANSLI